MAVENFRDIDYDSYPDVVTAAPYQGDGVVYIYRGYRDRLVADAYQVGHVIVVIVASITRLIM